MKLTGTSALALLVFAGTAVASPRESTTFPASIDSASNGTLAGHTQVDAITVLNQTFTGGYNAVRVNLTGTLNQVNAGSYQSEAQIYVIPPGGNAPFTIQVFTTAAVFTSLPIPAGYGVNLGAGYDPAGQWTYRFFETYQDGASGTANATWNDLVMTFDDAVPPPPPPPTADFDAGVLAFPGTPTLVTQSLDYGAGEVKWAKFIVPVGGVATANGKFVDIDTNGNTLAGGAFPNDTYITLFRQDGTIRAFNDDGATGYASQLSFGIGTRPAAGDGLAYTGQDGTLDAGTYYLALYAYPNAAGSPGAPFIVGTTSASAGSMVVNITTGQQAPPAPPTVFFDMGTIPTTGAFVTHTFGLDPATVKWAKITIGAVDAASQTYLDLDTETSTALNTAICLFRPDGSIAGQDTVDGSLNLSQLTFGAGTRAAVDTGGLYNGRDGATLAAGEYYVAATLTPATFANGWFAGSTSVDAGDLTLRVRSGTQGPAVAPTTFVTVNVASGLHTETTPINAGEVKWYKIVLAQDATVANNTFFDIDTENSSINDTYLSMFSDTGAVLSLDDDSGSGFKSQLTYGQTFPTRPAVGDGLEYDGFNGPLVAGTYWLAAYGYPNSIGSPAAGWNVGSASIQSGDLTVNFNFGSAQLPPGTFVKTADGGETVADAIVVGGNGTLTGISGFLTANHADVFRIEICDFANFSATTVGGVGFDTQLFLFKSLGDGVTMTDDNTGGIAGPSTITAQFVTTNGTYYLAITGYNRDPVDSDGNLLWNNEPFEGERAPDGPGAANVLAGWASTLVTPGAQPNYLITLTGACFVQTGPAACNLADVAGLGGSVGPDGALTPDDLIVFLNAFFTGNLAIADISILGGAAGHDGQLTPDDIVLFLGQFFSPCNP
ncbi:MAG: GC-type dockerin domain-anchored protein [Phycisphaerales bacterium]